MQQKNTYLPISFAYSNILTFFKLIDSRNIKFLKAHTFIFLQSTSQGYVIKKD